MKVFLIPSEVLKPHYIEACVVFGYKGREDFTHCPDAIAFCRQKCGPEYFDVSDKEIIEAVEYFSRNKKKFGSWALGQRKHKAPKPRPEWYENYIGSSAWRKKRQEALTLWGNHCALCRSEKDIQVHHNSYANIGHEPMEDLVVLCGECHVRHHSFMKAGVPENGNV